MTRDPRATPTRSLLYADDSESDRALVRHLWSRITTDAIVTVPDGQGMLDHLERCAAGDEDWPTLALVDLNMPGMSGFEVLERIRSEPRLALLRVLILSTSSRPEDVAESLSAGANGYVSKGLDFSDLEARLRATHAFWFDRVVAPRMQPG